MTSMRDIRLEKAVVNIGVGDAGERLLKAEKVLKMVTKRDSIRTLSKTTNRDFGIRKGMDIGVKVTLRGTDAEEFVRRALSVRDNKVAKYSFDPEGNFSFGVQDYTDFPGMKYDPEIGIFGLDVSVVLSRPGKRVKLRRIMRRHLPKHHKITKREGMQFIESKFNTEVVE